MSHCCGGCGGEDPLKKNEQASEKDRQKTAGKAATKETGETTGTWQPPKK